MAKGQDITAITSLQGYNYSHLKTTDLSNLPSLQIGKLLYLSEPSQKVKPFSMPFSETIAIKL